MGGSTVSDAVDKVKKVGGDTVKVVSGGTVDLEKGQVTFNPETMAGNVVEGATMDGTTRAAMEMSAPDMPKPGKIPSVKDQEAEAAKEVARRTAEVSKGGVASTILGGSLGDSTNIKKKKLLGE